MWIWRSIIVPASIWQIFNLTGNWNYNLENLAWKNSWKHLTYFRRVLCLWNHCRREGAIKSEKGLPFFMDDHSGFSSLFICSYRKPGSNKDRNHSLPDTEGILSANEGLRIHHGGESLVRKREARITKASIGITLMFLVCNTPRVIPNVVELLMGQNAFPKVRKTLLY